MDVCSDLSPAVEALDTTLEDLWNVLDDAAFLTSCENLNGLYQAAVYDELCEELPKGLLGFWVSCVILTVLLLVLVRNCARRNSAVGLFFVCFINSVSVFWCCSVYSITYFSRLVVLHHVHRFG